MEDCERNAAERCIEGLYDLPAMHYSKTRAYSSTFVHEGRARDTGIKTLASDLVPGFTLFPIAASCTLT